MLFFGYVYQNGNVCPQKWDNSNFSGGPKPFWHTPIPREDFEKTLGELDPSVTPGNLARTFTILGAIPRAL